MLRISSGYDFRVPPTKTGSYPRSQGLNCPASKRTRRAHREVRWLVRGQRVAGAACHGYPRVCSRSRVLGGSIGRGPERPWRARSRCTFFTNRARPGLPSCRRTDRQDARGTIEPIVGYAVARVQLCEESLSMADTDTEYQDARPSTAQAKVGAARLVRASVAAVTILAAAGTGYLASRLWPLPTRPQPVVSLASTVSLETRVPEARVARPGAALSKVPDVVAPSRPAARAEPKEAAAQPKEERRRLRRSCPHHPPPLRHPRRPSKPKSTAARRPGSSRRTARLEPIRLAAI